MFIDDLLDEVDRMPQTPLSIGASDPVDPLGRTMAEDAFISPRAAQPMAKPPIVATRDAIAPQRQEAVSRQAPSLLVRMGLFGRKSAARAEPVVARGIKQGAGLRTAASIQDKAGLRSEPAS